MAKHWIQNAIKEPGALSTSAKREHQDTAEYAEEHQKDSGKTGKRARLAETLMKLRKR